MKAKQKITRAATRKTRKPRTGALAYPLPLTHAGTVLPKWIDYNGHMNLSYYVLLFDSATDTFLERLGMTPAFRARRNASTFAAEIHVHYLRELRVGDEVRITTQLLDFDSKRIHFFHYMHHRQLGYLAATNELMSLYVDMDKRQVTAMPAAIQKKLQALASAQGKPRRPAQAGSIMGIRRELK